MSADRTRVKETNIEKVLPCVADLVKGRRTLFRYIDLDGHPQELDFAPLVSMDPWPIPLPVDREGYGTEEHSPRFWATGHGDWLNVKECLSRYGSGPSARLLDFGCATGRFLRHVLAFSEFKPYGCDFAPANVDWMKRHLPPDLDVFLNSSDPKLPFANQFFDMVTAFSVFTHIDADEEQWLLELRRIVRPDGLLYITIQNQATWDRVLDRPGSFEHLAKANQISGNLTITRALFDDGLPRDRLVLRTSKDTLYNCNVWHSNDYVQKNWGRWFDILKIADNAHNGFQSVVVMRPRHETDSPKRVPGSQRSRTF